jgi:hypothetical protein
MSEDFFPIHTSKPQSLQVSSMYESCRVENREISDHVAPQRCHVYVKPNPPQCAGKYDYH